MDDVVEVFGNVVCEDAVYDVSDDVDDMDEENDGHVEGEFDAANPDDASVVLDEAVDIESDVVVYVVVPVVVVRCDG